MGIRKTRKEVRRPAEVDRAAMDLAAYEGRRPRVTFIIDERTRAILGWRND